jgi:predicted membrane-bound spermidine synthase
MRVEASEGDRAAATAALCAIFAVSGAAALIFETLFFRLAGLALGNSVSAAAIVLFSFMAGLGIGNALAAPALRRVGRPLRLFAVLELLIGLYGAALVSGFPGLAGALAPLLSAAAGGPALDLLRLGAAFAFFVVPAIAMGMTLPVLVGALADRDPNYGRVLGRLYGWNTLGAVAGALAAERLLVLQLGVSGASLAAALLDGAAAAAALALDASHPPPRARAARPAAALPPDARRALLLASAFVSGGLLLALEVVWFRLFLLFAPALAWNLALMLATVLAGIGAGGLAGAAWFQRQPDAQRWLGHSGLAAGAAVALLYSGVAWLWPRHPDISPLDVGFALMFPVAFLSGLLFPLTGRALEARGLTPTRATGHLALANTAGSAIGSLVGGFVLIPRAGVEQSFAWVALGYGLAAALAFAALDARRVALRSAAAAALLYALAIAAFPFGALESRILAKPGSIRADLEGRGYELLTFREAVTETIQVFRRPLLDEPLHHVLVTNNHPMAGDAVYHRRYMKAYVYWAIAVNPAIRDALLISYGAGSTARALVEARGLERIDVVDPSAAILELDRRGDVASQPLRDPRVHVHVEDGRFFLQTTPRRFDLVTAEPPPPRHAGIGNLYSREYFALIRDRLREGGVVTYWLPALQLRAVETRAILRGFCDVFPTCSLWSGADLEWMMAAVVEPRGPVDAESFAAQWRDPTLARELTALGFPDPDSLGPTYIADGERLRRWIGDTPPLVDDRPQRIASWGVALGEDELRAHRALMADPAGESAFFASPELATHWPEAWRRPSPAFSARRAFLNDASSRRAPHRALHAVLAEPALAAFRAWAFNSDADAVAIVARARQRRPDLLDDPELPLDVFRHAAAEALVAGDLERVDAILGRWEERLRDAPAAERLVPISLRATALLWRGEVGRAAPLLREFAAGQVDPGAAQASGAFRGWARETFGLPPDPDLR